MTKTGELDLVPKFSYMLYDIVMTCSVKLSFYNNDARMFLNFELFIIQLYREMLEVISILLYKEKIIVIIIYLSL